MICNFRLPRLLAVVCMFVSLQTMIMPAWAHEEDEAELLALQQLLNPAAAEYFAKADAEKTAPNPMSMAKYRWAQVSAVYAVVGFEHILPAGLDHILFVLGLFLLSTRLKPLLWQVTAFTAAHSLTLGLSINGLIGLSSNIVEPLIAASICFVAIENMLTSELKPWRPFVVFAFGLLHGLGFAGVLTNLGLPQGDFLTSLIGFNLGVELGQLTIICLAFLAIGRWRHKTWYRARITIPCSLLIAATGAWWTVSRIFF